jgi:sugar phosphate permease
VLGLKGWQWLFILEGVPTALLGIACLFVLTDRPAEATWLTAEQREWLVGRMETEAARKKPIGHISLWELARNKYFITMALVCAGASASGSVLSVWQPQILKSFGLTNLQTGFVNSIPYGVATVVMILWGRHSDNTGERRWHTAIPLLLAATGFLALNLTGAAIVPSVLMVTCCLVGAYAFKGPFWALSAGWLSASTAAAGLAGINAISNLIGGGMMVNVVGVLKQQTGSFAIGMLPLVALTLAGAVSVLLISRGQTQEVAAPATA